MKFPVGVNSCASLVLTDLMSPPMLLAIFMNSADCLASCCCRCEEAAAPAALPCCMLGPPLSCLPWKERTALMNSPVRSRDADDDIMGFISDDGEEAAADANGISDEEE